ncbi:MAG: hypothetical protein V1847_00600 [Candidatus Diapherotrites archaeon]
MNWKIAFGCMALLVLLLAGCTTPVVDQNTFNNPTPVKISILSKPSLAVTEETFSISWKVEGGSAGNITHTSVDWDSVSHAMDSNDYAFTSNIFQGSTPDSFVVSLQAPRAVGTIFARAHAVVDGANYYSDEFEIDLIMNAGV